MANLINLERVSLARGLTPVLSSVTLGVESGERIGIVGLNGGGKTSLLELLSGHCTPDSGRVSLRRDVRIAYARQSAPDLSGVLVGDYVSEVIPSLSVHTDSSVREVLQGLGVYSLLERDFSALSGGQRRRVTLAQALISDASIILLDEPTNHLDIDSIAWLAEYLTQCHRTVLCVTHDRWFLDAVATKTWEVVQGQVHIFDGGYNDWIFARAQRERIAGVEEEKRRNLARKELAWLRRGAPARTSKPRYRIAAAEALISRQPEVRNTVELATYATQRLGKVAIELHNASIARAGNQILSGQDVIITPGARIGIVGANGTGKSTVLQVLAGELPLDSGKRKQGLTVSVGWLRQELDDLPHEMTVVDAISDVAHTVEIGGKEYSASQLAGRLGFNPDQQRVAVGRLSGGQKRRLQFTRVLMRAPNVLILDEPTNDMDIDTLQSIEDLLDHWVGTLIVVSHDRYLTERLCDDIYGFVPTENGHEFTHLPGGIPQYYERKTQGKVPKNTPVKPEGQLNDFELHKQLRRLETVLDKLNGRRNAILESMNLQAANPAKLMELNTELESVHADIAAREHEWLTLADSST